MSASPTLLSIRWVIACALLVACDSSSASQPSPFRQVDSGVGGGTGGLAGAGTGGAMVGTGGVTGGTGGSAMATGGSAMATGGSDGGTGSTGGTVLPGDAGVGATGGATGGATADYSDYSDPGTGDWGSGAPADCKIDPSLFKDSRIGTYAVFRYGLLCHMKGSDTAGAMYSATKTLGGTAIGRAAYLAKDVPRTGPGTGPIEPEDLGSDWIARPAYPRADATVSHIMSMVAAASPSLSDSSLTYRYDTVGSQAINGMIQAVEKCAGQVPGLPSSMVSFVQQEIFDKLGMDSSSYNTALGIASGWSANLSDMGKLGTLLAHSGWYNGEQLLSPQWVYRMSHPNFESANTSYGHLAWLNHRGNAAGIGGNISSGANAALGDPCAPAAFWPDYPHNLSEAPDCLADVGSCEQQHDVGVFSAQGLNGQFIVVHPGLDLVIAARNFSGGDGPLGLWTAIRPGVVAMDPMFQGDESSFCDAYGAGNYAPDLLVPRHP